jgi:succinate dehydrogenase / fumarate reductase cytochrome b subunit|tara:strand:+ start:203 stop:589 length:387 start_codon:yes stop_codon:yes gene_type:complete
MENKNNPLSPHLQIYSWNISSLLSITHRIVGVVNIIAIIFICLWTILLSLGESNYEFIEIFSQSFFGKFFIIFLSWSFSFHILNEIRHLAWDMGYGFDLKISQITGIITIFGSFIFAILIYLFGRNII